MLHSAPNAHDGVTPLWAACCMGHTSICRLLLAVGADAAPTPHREAASHLAWPRLPPYITRGRFRRREHARAARWGLAFLGGV
jgi:hypothetical protein